MIPYADVGLDLGGFARRKDLVRVIPLFQLGEGSVESARRPPGIDPGQWSAPRDPIPLLGPSSSSSWSYASTPKRLKRW